MRFNPIRSTLADVAATSTAALPPEPAIDWRGRFIAHYGRPGSKPVPVPYGQLAVVLSLRFNDSTPQIDHFNLHCPAGLPDLVLLLAPKQPKTEALARRGLGQAPELAVAPGMDWEWKSEHWRGGRGNYLQSSPFDLPPDLVGCAHFTFGQNTAVTRVFWEVDFAENLREGGTVEFHPHGNFHQLSTLNSQPNSQPGRITARMELNRERNGVEIHFSRRPPDAALQPLRDTNLSTVPGRRWQYTGFSRCWYARQTPENVAWAEAFVSQFNNVTGQY